MRRTTCSACGSDLLDQFLDLGHSPIADAYTLTPDEVSPTYPLEVAVCGKCRLVQLLEVLPADVLFGTGYSFYSSASAPLSAYHADYAAAVRARYPDLVHQGVVEIGCNDGGLLRHFTDVAHVGVDPSTGPATQAARRGCEILPAAFTAELAAQIRCVRGPAGVVIANHVLAHVEDVSDMLAGVAWLLDDDEGVAIVEVQYLPDLLVNNAFDLIYHEHRNFFSLTSLEHAANRHGLFVVDAELTDRQGGSLRATLAKPYRVMAQAPRVRALRHSEMWLNSFGAYEGMQGRAERIRARLVELLGSLGTVAAYGAPAKLTTLLSFCGLDVSTIRWCVDSTPAKQGRHIPGTAIPIVAPQLPARPDAYLLAAWNYAGAIMAANPANRWVIPVPAPVLL